MLSKSFVPLNKQQGALLVISMVMLLIMTILGLSAAGSSTLELRMASNSQDIATTLQAAESAVEATIEDVALLGQAINNSAGIKQSIQLDSNYNLADQPVSSEAQLAYQGYYHVGGNTLGELGAHYFEITGTGSMQGNVTTSTSQGVYLVIPNGG